MRVLVTRPQPAADATVALLAARGVAAAAAPLSAYIDLPFAMPDLAPIKALVFTSARAPQGFAPPEALDLPAYCTGDATAAAAARAGFRNVISADGNSGDLLRLLPRDAGPRAFLHVAGVHTARDLDIPRIEVYAARLADALPPEILHALAAGAFTAAALFSARAAARLGTLMPPGAGRGLDAICLSPRVAAGLNAPDWASVCIAERPRLDAMIDALCAK